jgi:large subunit ribosomal protein L3
MKRMRGLLGKKIGMTRFFNEEGVPIPATLIEVGPCTVVQVKTTDKDGYEAVQLGYLEQKEKRINKPLLRHFTKYNMKPHRILKEFRDFSGEVKQGDTILIDMFQEGEWIKISGLTKGKGFTGVVKRYGFRGGPKTHGQSDRARASGSIGQSSSPKRVFKGLKMAGRMGSKKQTVRNLKILKIFKDQNLMLVKGSVPGARNSIMEIRRSG